MDVSDTTFSKSQFYSTERMHAFQTGKPVIALILTYYVIKFEIFCYFIIRIITACTGQGMLCVCVCVCLSVCAQNCEHLKKDVYSVCRS